MITVSMHIVAFRGNCGGVVSGNGITTELLYIVALILRCVTILGIQPATQANSAWLSFCG